MIKKFTGEEWFSVRQLNEESAREAAAMRLYNAIEQLEPAADQREAYLDAIDAGVPEDLLNKWLDLAVETEHLSPEESEFIRSRIDPNRIRPNE